MAKKILLYFFFCKSIFCYAAKVDTVSIYSQVMQQTFKAVVIQPETLQDDTTKLPVVYLLHGYSGNFSNWITRVPALKNYVDHFQIIIVCPDGGYSGWYINSSNDIHAQYETYISTEVPSYIEKHYRVIPDRRARAITGLSMGGHGGLYLGLRHADYFGACGSISGSVDLRSWANRFAIAKRIGDTTDSDFSWKKYSVLQMIDTPFQHSSAIIIDCGTEDIFINVNRQLHQKLLALKIPHVYIERPGRHNWDYWRNAIEYQLLFFRKYFNQLKKI